MELAAAALDPHVGCTGSIAADRVLMLIAGSGGVTTGRLRRALRLPASTQSTVLRRLAARNLVRRRDSPTDGRVRVLEATVEGRREAERVAAVWRRADDLLLDQLTPGERDELGRLLRRAIAALSNRVGDR